MLGTLVSAVLSMLQNQIASNAAKATGSKGSGALVGAALGAKGADSKADSKKIDLNDISNAVGVKDFKIDTSGMEEAAKNASSDNFANSLKNNFSYEDMANSAKTYNQNIMQQIGHGFIGRELPDDEELGVWGQLGRTFGQTLRNRMGAGSPPTDPRAEMEKFIRSKTYDMEKAGYEKIALEDPNLRSLVKSAGGEYRGISGVGEFMKYEPKSVKSAIGTEEFNTDLTSALKSVKSQEINPMDAFQFLAKKYPKDIGYFKSLLMPGHKENLSAIDQLTGALNDL